MEALRPNTNKDLSVLRSSMEASIRQATFKAIQATVILVNKDLGGLLKQNVSDIVRIMKPLSQLKEVRSAFSNQYLSVRRERVREVLSDIQMSVRSEGPDAYFEVVMEGLMRFLMFDVELIVGRIRSDRNIWVGGRRGDVWPGGCGLYRTRKRGGEIFQEDGREV